MTFNNSAHIEISRKLKDTLSYRGIFNDADVIMKLKEGVFTIKFQFSKTAYTEKNMSIEIKIDFNAIISFSEILQDIEKIKDYAYAHNDITLNMTEKQYNHLTGGDSNYLLPIYKTIIGEALEYFVIL